MANGLGRGLSSLIPQKINKVAGAGPAGEAVVTTLSEEEKDKVLAVPPDNITVNPFQPRKNFSETQLNELKESIRQYGIIQPLILTKTAAGYELIAGERRLRAAKELGLKTVPAIIREADEQQKLEVALIENLQREDLNPIETALAYKKLMEEFNLNQDALAKRLGKARPTITNTIRYLNLPEEIQLALMQEKIMESHAKILAGLDTETKQLTLFRKIIHAGLSVDDAHLESRRMGGTKRAKIKINYQDKDKEFALRQAFGTKVEIRRKAKGGQIIIDFYSDDELFAIVDRVKK
jgi:ParB family chromosome partitioning protein